MTKRSRSNRTDTERTPNDIVKTDDPGGPGESEGPIFGPEVAARHRRLDLDEWDDVDVIGDVHGCCTELRALLREIDGGSRDLLVFVGDLVRKGPDSAGVLAFVREHDNAVSVLRNNEEKLVTGETTEPGLGRGEIGFCRSLPLAISFGNALVVHGGIDPRKPLAAQDAEDLLTSRSIPPENGYEGPFWFDIHDEPPRIFFGHTVLEAPLVTEDAVGLDTGCVYGGALTAYDYRADETVSVEGREHRERADHTILTP